MNAALALLASLLWGSSDFGGGRLSRRRSAVAVLARTQLWALGAVLVATALRGGFPLGRYLLYGAACGVIGPVALACYYRALALGPMGLVSPVAATGGVVPVLVGLAEGDRLGAARAAGIVLALLGAVFVATVAGPAPDGGSARTGVLLALVAGAGFGAFYPLIAAGAVHSTLGTLVLQRGLGTALLWLTLGSRRGRTAPVAGTAPVEGTAPVHRTGLVVRYGAVGLADLGANVAFALSSHTGSLAVVGTLGSLYPVVTAALAAALLRERLRPVQLAGAVVALTGVALLSR